MTTKVRFKGRDGEEIGGELAEPSGTGKAPAVVLIQDTRPEVYDEKNAKLAWRRTVDFLKKNLV
jgi:dienelactone hydrolase